MSALRTTPPAHLAAVVAVERDALDRWWFDLTDRERSDALGLDRAEPIPESMAVRLMLYGVGVDTAALVRQAGGRRVVLHAQPAVLTDYLDGVRSLL
ncbi:hypothetical protein GTR02_15965 [Kineococcus sp. R8]|uniref:hypothetical protein n=1 Tax=Kineococcus siccus TaxID=2696567 RepID=UPI001412E461|nr:hypothetical protein [Kineococcus siccus]NAZ83316.1 hypothetical protein [Kineococcus siccus]